MYITLSHKTKGDKIFDRLPLSPCHMGEIKKLQDHVSSTLDVPRTFALSSDEEFLESMEQDYLFGLFDGDRLAALALCIKNRETDRNLGLYCPEGDYRDYFTFDTIQVHEDYRGYGIQKYFLMEAEKLARENGAGYIAATVAPHNLPSHRNFDQLGYQTIRTLEMEGGTYGNARRELVRKEL